MDDTPKPPGPLAALLDELEACEPRLRALGVTEVGRDGVRLQLGAAPAVQAGDVDQGDDDQEEADQRAPAAPPPKNALEDPLTYGLQPGAAIPGFKRRAADDDSGDPRSRR